MSLRGEKILAVTGITAALRPGPLFVTLKQLAQADGLELRIRRRLKRFILRKDFDDVGELFPEVDYAEVLKHLPEMLGPQRADENLAGFADPDLREDYSRALGRAIGYLHARIPVESDQQLLATEQVPPAELAVAPFRRAYAVIDDPMRVFDEMAAGCLVPDQVEAFQAIFPELYQVAAGMVAPLFVEVAAQRPTLKLSYEKDQQLQVFLQKDSLDPELSRQIQRAFAAAREREGGSPEAHVAAARKRATEKLTPSQSLGEKGAAEP